MPRTSFLPTSSPSTNSGRLSHHMVSLRLGSDVPGKTQNTWKLPDISSLHNVSKTGTFITFDEGANLYFLQKDIRYRRSTCPYRPLGRRASWRAPSAGLRPRGQNQTIALAIGGAERDRTADPLLAKQVLSQLSYSPNHRKHPTAKPPGIR